MTRRVILAGTIALAAWLWLYHMPDRPVVSDVWLWTMGFNLHKTHFLNLGAHVTENFVKSLVYAPYGWADTLPAYVASGIYDVLHIPLSEFWIYFMHVFLGLLSIPLIYLAGRKLFNAVAGLISAAIFAILPIHITVFGSSLIYHHDFLILAQLLILLSLLNYLAKKSWSSALMLSGALFLNAGTENLVIFPAVIMFQYLMEQRVPFRWKSVVAFVREVCAPRYLAIWVAPVGVLGMHLYIFYRLGDSHLGILGYVTAVYGVGAVPLSRFGTFAINQLALVYTYFFGVFAVMTVSVAVFCVVSNNGDKRREVGGLLAWVVYVFAVNVWFKQSVDVPHFKYSHYFVPLMLIAGYTTWYSVTSLARSREGLPGRSAAVFILLVVYAGLFTRALVDDVVAVAQRQVYSNPVKAVSFFVRERGGVDATVFQLVSASSMYNTWGEYYFGTLYIEPGDVFGVRRQLFAFGEHEISEYQAAYHLSDFDFYVDYHDGPVLDRPTQAKREQFLASLELRGVRNVADVERAGRVVATIYSARPFVHEILDSDVVDPLWDRKYANLDHLLQNRWSGLAALWGYHHRLQ